MSQDNNQSLMPRQQRNLAQSVGKVLDNATVDNKEEVVSLTGHFFHNLAQYIFPFYQLTLGTWKDYVDEKINKKREAEIDSCIEHINKRLNGVELKQEAVDYFEDSIVFRLEDITRKLLTHPGRGFDEVIAEFVATALQNLDVHPQTKDLVLSTLLNLDSVDLLVLKTMDQHFLSNLPKNGGNGAKGVTRDSICTLLKDRAIDEAVIDRSIQRLQSESLIQPMKVSSPMVAEAPTADELYKGKRPDQFDYPGGYINTGFGRVFINFLKLSK
ncbi:hypothetical protein H6802_00700 [Candidatus Nomurabacteria bacterium]|nr:hypothetical protein [Candidatus Nomurabacteria bacterium]MCB9827750.1 hypothetical protein [Candidatus Nomurabacteria bacterium]